SVTVPGVAAATGVSAGRDDRVFSLPVMLNSSGDADAEKQKHVVCQTVRGRGFGAGFASGSTGCPVAAGRAVPSRRHRFDPENSRADRARPGPRSAPGTLVL